VLNREADGEQIAVTRGGAPIAVIAAPAVRLISAERFRELRKTAPEPDDGFADELRALRRSVTAPSSSRPT
jgi:antitoxin (DNA-binding transcriptional repressor) of toxin-antitoxin stability system